MLASSSGGAAPTIAVITGASRGLGLAVARRTAEMLHDGGHDARVILTARGAGAAASAADVLRSEGVHVESYSAPLDVSDARSVSAFNDYTASDLGGIDLLINNAAICEPGWEADVVQRTLRTNVLGPLAMARVALPGMLRRGRGHVLHVSSGDGELVYLHPELQGELRAAQSAWAVLRTLARAAPPRDAFGAAPAHGPTPAYSLSKAALNALTRIAAAELAHERGEACGVRVSAVCPGDVLTRMCVDEHARQLAVAPSEAAVDVAWLAVEGLRAHEHHHHALPSGRFWRAREEISF